jgi:septal ring factor EnvC (AmiA/AmiB activator)
VIPIKLKLIIGGVMAAILAGGGFYLGSGMADKGLEKKLREAESTVSQLQGERDSLETTWQNKEADFEKNVKSLNDRLNRLQRENNVLEDKIKELEKQRAEIVVPDNPDDIVNDFRKLGFRSCTRVRKPKR